MNKRFSVSSSPIKLFRHPQSGHCHRVELMLALLELPYEAINLDMENAAHKAPAYLSISPFGQIPAIDDNGTTLADSNAILVYLVRRYGNAHAWIPDSAIKAAEVQRWLSVAAGEIRYGPCDARLIKLFGAPLDYDRAKTTAESLFAVMQIHLEARKFLVDNEITLADIACYSYIAHAPEGGLSLQPYPAIRAWLGRIEAQPKFLPMVSSQASPRPAN